MGEAYRGLTIQLKADGTKVMSTLTTMNKAARATQQELRLVNKALKFDGANESAVRRQMQLLGQQAGVAQAQAGRLRVELSKIARTDVGGKTMRELARETHNAESQAAHMLVRYNQVTKVLAGTYQKLEHIWNSEKRLENMKNPFRNWEGSYRDIGKITEGLRNLVTTHKLTRKEAEAYLNEIKRLKELWHSVDADNKLYKDVAAFESAKDKLLEMEAAVKRYRNALRQAAWEAKPTGFEDSLKRTEGELRRLEARANSFKQAMRADPSSWAAYNGGVQAAKDKMRALMEESKILRREMAQLGREEGVKELAADAQKLQTAFVKTTYKVQRTSDELAEAQAKAEKLRDEITSLNAELANPQDRGVDEINKDLEKMNGLLVEANAHIDKMQANYDSAALDAKKVGSAMRYAENESRIVGNNAAMAGMANQKSAKKSMLSTSALTSLGMSMYATVYPAALMGGSYAIQAADEIDAAYRDMRKTVQGTETDFERLRQAALEFGDTHYTSADTILEFEAMGGQLGITVENLESFAKTVSNLDIATNMDSEDIALDLGKMANIMHLNVDEYDRFADSLVRLGNSEPALESDIMAITARFAGMATIVGSTPDEILAIATAATATGQKAEAAGGSLQRTFGRIEGAVAGVSEDMKNLEDLSEEDIEAFEAAKESLQGYADVAGMSSEAFASLWERDATSAFQKFVEGLKRIGEEGGSVDATLQNLGITGVRDRQLLEGLTNTTDVLSDSLRMSKNAFSGISDEFGAAGDAAREASNKSKGFSGTLQILKNNGQHLAAILGEAVTPWLRDLTDMVSTAVNWFDKLGLGAQQAVMAFAGLGVLSGPLMTMTAAMRNAWGSLTEGAKEYMSTQAVMGRLTQSQSVVYARNAALIDKNTAKMARMDAILEKTRKRGQNTQTTQRLAAARDRTYLQTQAAERSNKKMAVMSGLKGIGSSLAGMAAFTGATILIEQFAEAVMEAMERAENLKAATEGVRDSADRLAKMAQESAEGVEKLNAAFSTKSLAEYKAEAEEVIAEIAKMNDEAAGRMDDAVEGIASAGFWTEQVLAAERDFDGSASSLARLKDAVDEYNAATGSSLQVVDNLTGALSMNTDEILTNLDAYKNAAMEKAFADVAQDYAKAEASAFVERAQFSAKILENEREIAAIKKEAGGEENLTSQQQRRIEALDRENGSLAMQAENMDKIIESSQYAKEKAYELLENQKALTDATRQQKEEMDATARSASTYSKSVGGDSFKALAEQAGYAEDSIDDFSASLYEAQISSELLGRVGADAFSQLYEKAGGNLANVKTAMQAIDDFGFKVKDIEITDNGVEVKGHVIDLDNLTIDDKPFTVTSKGTIEASDAKTRELLKQLGILGKTVATPKVEVNVSGLSSLREARSLIDNAKSKSVDYVVNTVRTYKSIVEQTATGGISRNLLKQVPRHASGGLTGIATRAVLTNNGLVGEDGTEALIAMGRSQAIVPLSNRRYVRPFARAVASEMGSQSSSSSVHNHYSIGDVSFSEGSDGAAAIKALFNALNVGKAS